MKLLSLYKPFTGPMTDFTNSFINKEHLYNQSTAFCKKLEGSSLIILIIMLFLGIFMAFCYYQPYNNVPGRHYRPQHWLYFLVGTFVLTFLATIGFEYIAIPPKLDGAFVLELRIALGNAIYSSALYFFVSFLWCNYGPTNACRIFKL